MGRLPTKNCFGEGLGARRRAWNFDRPVIHGRYHGRPSAKAATAQLLRALGRARHSSPLPAFDPGVFEEEVSSNLIPAALKRVDDLIDSGRHVIIPFWNLVPAGCAP
jgi:hypothetical protein